MRLPGFIGDSYESQGVTADQERTVNWYVEPMESKGATTDAALYPTPGVETLDTSVTNPGRAHFYEDGREFCIIGDTFYEVDSVGVLTSHGTVALDENPATICSGGDLAGQLFITSGTYGYYFTLSTNTLTQIANLDGKATMGGYLDGYFLCLDSATSTLYTSDLGDASSWTTGTDFAQRNLGSDPWISMGVLGRYVWLLGESTSEVWYNTGGTFPLSFHPSGYVRYGCAAPFSVAIANESIFWLGRDRTGDGMVLRGSGFVPDVVSNYTVSTSVNNMTTISDAQAYSYTEHGHTFYVLNFPSENQTWCNDVGRGLQAWTERGTWKSKENQFVEWRVRWAVQAFGELRALDSEGGQVYRMSTSISTDVDGGEIRRLRRSPAIMDENRRMFWPYFEVDLESGVGLVTGQGSDPQVMMRFSDDGGKTWSNEYWRTGGALGNYGTRVRWNRLGAGRRRVYEVSVSDPIPWRLTAAYSDPEREYGVK